MYHTRYDIISNVLKTHPFYFKISNNEPYGESREVDDNGNVIIERYDNREFVNYDIIWFDTYFGPEKFSKLKL